MRSDHADARQLEVCSLAKSIAEAVRLSCPATCIGPSPAGSGVGRGFGRGRGPAWGEQTRMRDG